MKIGAPHYGYWLALLILDVEANNHSIEKGITENELRTAMSPAGEIGEKEK